MKDPRYIERVLNTSVPGGACVTALPERSSFIKDNPDAAIGFLLGKGLRPQEIMDVLECWWHQGHGFAERHLTKTLEALADPSRRGR